MLAFVTALGEFVSSIVIYTVDSRPISVEILAQLRQFNFGSAAAYGVLLILMIAAVFLLFGRYPGRTSQARRPLTRISHLGDAIMALNFPLSHPLPLPDGTGCFRGSLAWLVRPAPVATARAMSSTWTAGRWGCHSP